ncbi:leucine aminopeptidase [Klebsormidium nitens]|uniref:Leucine aminopeptidase n=1 Tax=Klebsormidium nitens TaxID=105231 RepID=A0A1Y1I473_KLENI|nr:leucine aminopeptidase [Klebsormidium nitens]|eukprot:GAQ84752.1 leucine aminopeptidase [Klebsormidium nitens]
MASSAVASSAMAAIRSSTRAVQPTSLSSQQGRHIVRCSLSSLHLRLSPTFPSQKQSLAFLPPSSLRSALHPPHPSQFSQWKKLRDAALFRPRTLVSSATASDASLPLGLTRAAAPLLPQIDISPSGAKPEDYAGDLLVLGLFSEAVTKSGDFQKLTATGVPYGELVGELVQETDFKGKPGQTAVVRVSGEKVKRVAIVGLGSSKESSVAAGFRALGQALATIAKESKALSAGVAVVGREGSDQNPEIAGAIAAGAVLGSYEDQRFKSEPKPITLAEVDILGLGTSKELKRAIGVAARLAAGVILTKQLVNAPPNILTPAAMAEVAENIAAAHADVMTVKILEKEECEQLGMGAYLGVSAASELPPKFIHLTYTPFEEEPKKEPKKKLVIIGKGLTFDSGGYNLKAGPGSMIEQMKFDMGGAGAALGAAKAIGAIQPEGVEVHFIVAACENMISGTGMRPGDILTASNGKTIEVNNTDAEGRLTLADALVYACKLEPDAIVDLATLTGACIVALGGDIAGLFTPFDSVAEELSAAAKAAGEKFWRMPMEEAYKEQLKSPIADFVNTGSRAGGSITASLFLKEFVDEKIPWAHLDIAGPVWNEKKGGATGFAVQTLVRWVQSHATAAASL